MPTAREQLDVLIVGAGFAGLYMLYAARRAGLSARVLDSASGVGGTWFHNRYPGARVDSESMEYSYSFDEALQQDWHWTERYAPQPEILRYLNHVADRFSLRDGIELRTRVASTHFDEPAQRWDVRAEDGRQWLARFLVMASGQLSTPATPAWPGAETFAGRVLHTGAWPHEPVSFAGVKVGVVGTSSSGVQAIPAIARDARELTVFQRTPCYAVPAHNGPLDLGYEAEIKADYAGFRARNKKLPGGFGASLPPSRDSALAASPKERQAIFEQRWQAGGFAFLGAFNDLLLSHEANGYAAEFVREKIRALVRDRDTAELLCPSFPLACRRLCVEIDYYASYNRDNVRLFDVSREPIARVSTRGLVTRDSQGKEREHAIDLLVLATGFDAITGALARIDVRGRSGRSLADKWRDGPLNYLGLMMEGFPNLFHVTGPGSTLAFTNAVVAIEQHVEWITRCILDLQARDKRTIEPTAKAEAAWVAYVNAAAERTVFLSCNSWYLGSNVPGKPRVFMPLAAGFPRYAAQCEEARDKGYEGFVLG